MGGFWRFSSNILNADCSFLKPIEKHKQYILFLLQQIQHTGEQACTHENNF